MRSSTSKSRIPKSVSRQGSITSERSLQSARGSTSASRLPRPGSSTSQRSQRSQESGAKPSKRQDERRGSRSSQRSQRKDSWGDSAPPTPVDSVPPTPRDESRGVTPRDNFLPTPRGSILSAVEVRFIEHWKSKNFMWMFCFVCFFLKFPDLNYRAESDFMDWTWMYTLPYWSVSHLWSLNLYLTNHVHVLLTCHKLYVVIQKIVYL